MKNEPTISKLPPQFQPWVYTLALKHLMTAILATVFKESPDPNAAASALAAAAINGVQQEGFKSMSEADRKLMRSAISEMIEQMLREARTAYEPPNQSQGRH